MNINQKRELERCQEKCEQLIVRLEVALGINQAYPITSKLLEVREAAARAANAGLPSGRETEREECQT